MKSLGPVRLEESDHPPGPVTIYDASGRKVVILTVTDFRKRQMTSACVRHRVVQCPICRGALPDRPFYHQNAAARAAEARRAARKRWTK